MFLTLRKLIQGVQLRGTIVTERTINRNNFKNAKIIVKTVKRKRKRKQKHI